MHKADNEKFEDKLKSLEAFLISKEEGPDKALEALGESTDPEIIRRRLGILLDSDRIDEAIELLNTIELDERWCDRAVCVYVKKGDTKKAKELIEWAKARDDELLKNRCRVFYAEVLYSLCWKDRKKGDVLFPDTLSNEEKNTLDDCLSVLNPMLAKVIAENQISNEIESLAVQLSIEMSYLLNKSQEAESLYKSQEAEKLCRLLSKRKPLPVKLGRFALSKICEVLKETPEQYRSENPESLEVHILASLMESELFDNHVVAFKNIKNVKSLISKKDEKENYCNCVYQIAQNLGIKALNEARLLSEELLGKNHRFTLLVCADILIRENKYDLACKCLEKAKDETDTTWLQIFAIYLYNTGNQPESLEYMNKAYSITPHAELRRSMARIAFDTESYDLSIKLLKQELTSDPKSISNLNNLAAAFFRKGDYKSATEYFEKLIQLKPDDMSHLKNLATCYTQSGEVQKAIETYDIICRHNDAPLEAFLLRSFVLKINDPIKALESILPLKEKYWDDLQYLQVLLDLSYKSGKEEYGHKAFMKLRELQHDGKVPAETLQVITIDDLKDHAKQWNEKVKTITNHVLCGKFPWPMADYWQNHTVYMGWAIRTQSINWYIEEPMTCAAFSVYSTNRFRTVKRTNDMTVLDVIECPPKDKSVVIDLSALITLHRLNLLDRCFEYFSKIYLPEAYLALLLGDSESLVIGQLSRKTSAEAIKNEIDLGHITILDDIGLPEKRPLPFVHEHTLPENEEEHYYRLIDVINPAYDAGKLNEVRYDTLKQIAHKHSGNDADHPLLKYGESIFVDLHTLYSICQADAKSLSPILETFKIFISKQDHIRNSNDITQIGTQENIKSMNEGLLNICREDERLVKQPHTKDSRVDDDVFLASWALSKELSLPLLADDRVLQNLAIHENKDVELAAFGVDSLLPKLFEEKLIDIDVLSDTFLQLVSWRYRFIVPSREVLLNLAKRYKGHPPGKDLQEIALYVHACMRSPGLFGGTENTTRKESMAARLYLCWVRLTVEFIVDVWADSDFTEEAAKSLTEWAVIEFMPSLPRALGANNLNMAANSLKAILGFFLAFNFRIKDVARADKALQIIIECLNIDEIDYFKAVSEVIDRYEI